MDLKVLPDSNKLDSGSISAVDPSAVLREWIADRSPIVSKINFTFEYNYLIQAIFVAWIFIL